jgi:WD40 repeat protein
LAVWDARTGTRLLDLRGHRGSVQGALLLAPNRALSWSDDGTLRIWDLQLGSTVEILRGHARAVDGVQTLPGGRLLSWSAKDRSVRLWEYDGAWTSRVLASPQGEVGGVFWLGQERVLTWSGGFPDRSRSHGDRTLSLCDVTSGQVLWTVTAHRQDIINMTVLSDTSLLTWSRDGTLARWDASDGCLMHRFKGHEYWVMGAIEMNPSILVTWSQDDTIRAWNLQDGTDVLIDEVARPVSSGCRLDGHRFAIWGDGLTVWDLRDLAHPVLLEGHAQSITDVLPLQGGQILTWAVDETLRRWDPAQVIAYRNVRPPVAGKVYPAQAGAQESGHAEWVRGALALDNGEIASWSCDHSVRIWNPQSGSTRLILSGHRFWVMGVVELPGSRLASWSFDCDVMVWDLASGRSIATLEGSRRQEVKRAWHDALTHDHWVNGLVVVNPHSLASWAEDCTLRIWDLETLQERHVILLESVPSNVARLDADTVCAWWEEDSAVQSWSVSTGQSMGTMTGEEFVYAHPAHREWIAETGDDESVVFCRPDFEASVSEGVLRLAHHNLGDLYWHSGRTLELHCLANGDTICVSPTEKDLAFVRLEVPQMPAASD